MYNRKLIISKDEKFRILNLHETKKRKEWNLLFEQYDDINGPKDVLGFQQYVINTIGDKTVLGTGGASGYGDDGVYGKRTKSAWNTYKDSYLQNTKQVEQNDDVNGPKDVLGFQQYVINTIGDKTVLGTGGDSGYGDDGVYNDKTKWAWSEYKDSYLQNTGQSGETFSDTHPVKTKEEIEEMLKVITDENTKNYFRAILTNPNAGWNTTQDGGFVIKKNESGKLLTGEYGYPDGYRVDVNWYLISKQQADANPNVQYWFTDNGQNFNVYRNVNGQLVGDTVSVGEGQTPKDYNPAQAFKDWGVAPPIKTNYRPDSDSQSGTTPSTAATTTNQTKLLDRVPTNKEIRQGLRRRKRINNRMDRQKRKQLDDLYNQYERIAGSIQKFAPRDDGSIQFKQQMATLENQMNNINAQISKLEAT